MQILKRILLVIANSIIPYYKDYKNSLIFSRMNGPSYFEYVKFRLGGGGTYWYYPSSCMVANSKRIFVGKNSLIGRPFSYINGSGGIFFGDYVQLGPNVAILSGNHDLYDQRKTNAKPIKIGDYSWIGFGARVLAGVELGPRTIVASNAVVTKSFPEGNCVLAGVPAKKIKDLDPDRVVRYTTDKEYYGMIPSYEFPEKIRKYLDVTFLKRTFPDELSSH